MPTGFDPAGTWTLRFYEFFDDGGTASIDARWTVTATFTDEPLPPPAATDLGTLTTPGGTFAGGSISSGVVKWYSFTAPLDVPGTANRYMDIDTFGSTIAAGTGTYANDTSIGLYDSAGNRIATDDDSCDGFTSQLSFGAGTRPPQGDGVPYDGRNGPLPAGLYYLAVGTYPTTFGAQRWAVTSSGTQSGTIALRVGTNLGQCYGNCDGSTVPPVVNTSDFTCFLQQYSAGIVLPSTQQQAHYANCDGSTIFPQVNTADFTCFLQKYAAGCS
jgi:hypothetical protein